MTSLLGLDGCKGGWIVAESRGSSLEVYCNRVDSLHSLFIHPGRRLVTVDVPIGLLPTGARECDQQARRLLGPRKNSVFTPLLRPLLDANTYAEASALRRQIEGKGITKQAWAIRAKIREADQMLRSHPSRRESTREVHPEVCFCHLNGGIPMTHAKKTKAGRDERLALLRTCFGDAIERALLDRKRMGCEADDILDAFVALWTARRIDRGQEVTLPAVPPVDEFGLRMEIVA